MKRWSGLGALGAVVLVGLACGGLFGGGDEALLEERPPESPLTWGLLMSWLALGVGGGSAVVGIWVDRDKSRPLSFAMALSGLILAAMGVGALQGYLDEEGAIETRANLERMLDMVEDIAESSGDPELAALVNREGKARRPRAKAKGKAKGKADATPEPTEPAPTEPAPTEPAPDGSPDGGTPDGGAPAEGEAPAGGDEGKAAKSEGGGGEGEGKAGKGKGKAKGGGE